MTQHTSHAELGREIASWYENPDAMGFAAEKRRFGWYRTNTHAPSFAAVTVTDLDPECVPSFLQDVQSYFGDRSVPIDLTQDSYSPAVAEALREHGYTNGAESVYLAHVADLPAIVSEGVRVESAPSLREFCRVKLMAFDDSEDEPSDERLRIELEMRTAEAAGEGRFSSASVAGEIVGICGFYEGQDYGIFILGTRVPFRRRGVASALLRSVLDEAGAASARSVIIWTDAGGKPEALYRKLGFTDVVHRRWRFTKPGT